MASISPTSARRDRRIDFPTVLVAISAAVVSYGIGVTLLITIPMAPAVAGLAQYLVSGLAPIIAAGVAAATRARSAAALGIRGVRPRWIAIAIGLGALAIIVSVVVTLGIVLLLGVPGGIQSDYDAASRGGPLLLVLTLIAGAALTPIGEELLFRGVLANWVLRWSAWIAVPVSAALFAVAHGFFSIAVVAFIIGVINALLFRATRSIWPGVIVHAINNAYVIVSAALISGSLA